MGAGLTDNAARAIGATLTNLQRLSISRSAELGVRDLGWCSTIAAS